MAICECTSVGKTCAIPNNKCIALQSVWWVLDGWGQLSDPVGFGWMAQTSDNSTHNLIPLTNQQLQPGTPDVPSWINLAHHHLRKQYFLSIPGKVLFIYMI